MKDYATPAQIREARGSMSRAEAAAVIGYSQDAFAKWEQGSRNMTVRQLNNFKRDKAMSRIVKFQMITLCCLLLFISACGQVAITGRKQLNLVPDSVMNSMSLQSYNDFLS